MGKARSYLIALAAGASALSLAACGGGNHSNSSSMTASTPTAPAAPAAPATPPAAPATPAAPASTAGFQNTALVGNTAAGTMIPINTATQLASGDSATVTFPATAHSDPNLSGAWGIAFGPGAPVWVDDEPVNLSTLYDGTGASITALPSVQVPGNPTGIVANINTITCTTVAAAGCTAASGFSTTGGAAKFMFATLSGVIYAWNSGAAAVSAATGASGSSYTGLAIFTQASGSTFLLAANFGTGKVDVYNSSFQADTTSFPNAFTDPNLPAGYAPFGIQQIGNKIYVSYAMKPTSPGPEVDGEGLGMIDVFDGTGKLISELVKPGGALNAPWGMALAPTGFGGGFDNDLLVGNFGDGRINVYDPNSGAVIGVIKDSTNNQPVHIPGLWGIAFGNGADSQSATTLYYAAQSDHNKMGLYGSLAAASAPAAAAAPAAGATTPTPPPQFTY